MTVYVDDARTPWRRGMKMSHVTADTVEELVAFGRRIGFKRQWLQNIRCPHFDVSESHRRQAIQLGAVATTEREVARIGRAAGEAWDAARKGGTPG